MFKKYIIGFLDCLNPFSQSNLHCDLELESYKNRLDQELKRKRELELELMKVSCDLELEKFRNQCLTAEYELTKKIIDTYENIFEGINKY